MTVSQKPRHEVVSRAAHVLRNPKEATTEDALHFAARIMDDENNAPEPNKADPAPELNKSQRQVKRLTDLRDGKKPTS